MTGTLEPSGVDEALFGDVAALIERARTRAAVRVDSLIASTLSTQSGWIRLFEILLVEDALRPDLQITSTRTSDGRSAPFAPRIKSRSERGAVDLCYLTR